MNWNLRTGILDLGLIESSYSRVNFCYISRGLNDFGLFSLVPKNALKSSSFKLLSFKQLKKNAFEFLNYY